MDQSKIDTISSQELLKPSESSLLYMQDSHVTKLIWSGHVRDCIRPNDHSLTVSGWKLTEAQIVLLKKSGFYEMYMTGYVHLDSHLITAVLDRWRPETNTFHFPFGEMTVTLEDVAFILGLPVVGKVVCGRCPEVPSAYVKKMLGQAPKSGTDDLSGNRIRLTWLRKTFAEGREPKSQGQVVCCTRAYILYLLGCTLFSDSGNGYVHIMYLTLLEKLEEASTYAWGAAALAYLYRAMTKAVTIGEVGAQVKLYGSFTLLMCWIFEHLPIGRPNFQPENRSLFPLARKWNQAHVSDVGRQPYLCVRPLLDKLRREDVTFQPYLEFPKPCKSARNASKCWCVDLVLVCFNVIEAYNGSRCIPQFGKVQSVPKVPPQLKTNCSSRASSKKNYPKLYSNHIKPWDAYVKDPTRFVKAGKDAVGDRNITPAYEHWYGRVSIRRVEPYTYIEANWMREVRGLKEAIAEYVLLTQSKVKEFLKDKRSRVSELFELLAPIGGIERSTEIEESAADISCHSNSNQLQQPENSHESLNTMQDAHNGGGDFIPDSASFDTIGKGRKNLPPGSPVRCADEHSPDQSPLPALDNVSPPVNEYPLHFGCEDAARNGGESRIRELKNGRSSEACRSRTVHLVCSDDLLPAEEIDVDPPLDAGNCEGLATAKTDSIAGQGEAWCDVARVVPFSESAYVSDMFDRGHEPCGSSTGDSLSRELEESDTSGDSFFVQAVDVGKVNKCGDGLPAEVGDVDKVNTRGDRLPAEARYCDKLNTSGDSLSEDVDDAENINTSGDSLAAEVGDAEKVNTSGETLDAEHRGGHRLSTSVDSLSAEVDDADNSSGDAEVLSRGHGHADAEKVYAELPALITRIDIEYGLHSYEVSGTALEEILSHPHPDACEESNQGTSQFSVVEGANVGGGDCLESTRPVANERSLPQELLNGSVARSRALTKGKRKSKACDCTTPVKFNLPTRVCTREGLRSQFGCNGRDSHNQLTGLAVVEDLRVAVEYKKRRVRK